MDRMLVDQALLEVRVGELETALQSAVPQPEIGAVDEATTEPAADPAPRPDRHDLLEEDFSADAPDRAALDAESTLISVFSDATTFPGAIIRDVACRSQMCRVELGYSNDDDANLAMTRTPSAIPWPGTNGNLTRFDEADEIVLVAFVAREGERLQN